MARTYSEMIELGTKAPAFDLPAANPGVDLDGKQKRSLRDYPDARAVVIVFTCNHCPYAQHIEDALIETALEYQSKGVQFVAISSNDPVRYPQDDFNSMRARADEKDYPFPYLFDESQDVARAYGAVCTPDFFVFNADRRLAYRGRFDDTRPDAGTATGEDLRAALDQLLEKEEVTVEQHPSMGCNIKWKT